MIDDNALFSVHGPQYKHSDLLVSRLVHRIMIPNCEVV